MTPDDFAVEADTLCSLCHLFGARGWCRATSGNFSVRVDSTHCLITQSGCEKSRLTHNDLMICDLEGRAMDPNCQPSAETLLHTALYKLDETTGAVLHTHSVNSTLLSQHCGSSVEITGFEMQKAMSGISSHEQKIDLHIFNNEQDMMSLAEKLETAWNAGDITVPGFLIAGHGLYAWGRDATDAQRHLEGFEFLLDCKWQETVARHP